MVMEYRVIVIILGMHNHSQLKAQEGVSAFSQKFCVDHKDELKSSLQDCELLLEEITSRHQHFILGLASTVTQIREQTTKYSKQPQLALSQAVGRVEHRVKQGLKTNQRDILMKKKAFKTLTNETKNSLISQLDHEAVSSSEYFSQTKQVSHIQLSSLQSKLENSQAELELRSSRLKNTLNIAVKELETKSKGVKKIQKQLKKGVSQCKKDFRELHQHLQDGKQDREVKEGVIMTMMEEMMGANGEMQNHQEPKQVGQNTTNVQELTEITQVKAEDTKMAEGLD